MNSWNQATESLLIGHHYKLSTFESHIQICCIGFKEYNYFYDYSSTPN